LSLSWTRPVHSTPPYSIFSRSNFVIYLHTFGLPSGLFPWLSYQ
jgi:hypothetical protein